MNDFATALAESFAVTPNRTTGLVIDTFDSGSTPTTSVSATICATRVEPMVVASVCRNAEHEPVVASVCRQAEHEPVIGSICRVASTLA